MPGVASNLHAALMMTTASDNDAAPTPNHALIASLLPTIRPPAALLEPDGHTKRTTAQAVIGKVMSLCGGRIGSASVDLSSDSFELEERDGAHFG